MMRCKYCGLTFDQAFAEAMLMALGARISGRRDRCQKAPPVLKRGPRGGIKYVREHSFAEVNL
jgi:hypothetical protein